VKVAFPSASHQHLVAEILDDGVEHVLALLPLDTGKKWPPVRYLLNACSRDAVRPKWRVRWSMRPTRIRFRDHCHDGRGGRRWHAPVLNTGNID
jgi:hypothetical protein